MFKRAFPILGTIILLSAAPTEADTYTILKKVNRDVNWEIRPMSDKEQYGRELLVVEPKSGYGDCEDYAATKVARLKKLGIETELVVVIMPDGGWHAVAVYEGDLVLDSLHKNIQKVAWLERIGWRFAWRKKEAAK